MNLALGSRDQRALLIGGAGLIGLVVLFRGVPAWRSWRSHARLTAAEVMSQAARTDVLLAGFAPALDTLQARTTQVRAMGPVVVTDETVTGAASNLTAFLGDLGRQSLVRLDAVAMQVDSTGHHVLPRITVDLQATADITGLTSFLRNLEQGPTLLAVRRLVVTPQNADAPAATAEMLSIHLTVEGLALVRQSGNGP